MRAGSSWHSLPARRRIGAQWLAEVAGAEDVSDDAPVELRPGAPLVGPGEAQRLVALYELDALDSSSAECFDRVARLASRLFEVPYTVIALVDAVREWHLAQHGALPRELPRELSFADEVIRSGDLLAVEDATSSLTLFDHPYVSGEPKVRFVAGCPLRSSTGAPVGAIYVLAPYTRTLAPAEAQMLHDLAGVVEDELAMRANRSFDETTGLLLRRGLDIVGGHVISRARRRGEPVSMIVVDVDVDSLAQRSRPGRAAAPAPVATVAGFGPRPLLSPATATAAPASAASVAARSTGYDPVTELERAVELVARIVAAMTRASDIPAKLPCDEIAVLLPETDARGCRRAARRLEAEIAAAAAEAAVAGHRFAFQVATATLDSSAKEMSIQSLLRVAAPLDEPAPRPVAAPAEPGSGPWPWPGGGPAS